MGTFGCSEPRMDGTALGYCVRPSDPSEEGIVDMFGDILVKYGRTRRDTCPIEFGSVSKVVQRPPLSHQQVQSLNEVVHEVQEAVSATTSPPRKCRRLQE